MWFLIAGVTILLLASVIHSYCAVGLKARPTLAPAIFYTGTGTLLQWLWIVLFLIGVALVFVFNWIIGIIAIPVYWLILPLLVTPIMKRWMLPSWDSLPNDLKDTLTGMGYEKNNYLKGNWWRRDVIEKERERMIRGE